MSKKQSPRCTARVSRGGWRSYQCAHAAKHDPDENGIPTRCGIHSEAAKAKREAKSDARYEAWRQEERRERLRNKLRAEAVTIVRQIADGHNDPRGLASDWVCRFDEVEKGE